MVARSNFSEEAMDSHLADLQSISADGPTRATVGGSPLDADERQRIQKYWGATLYLSAATLYTDRAR